MFKARAEVRVEDIYHEFGLSVNKSTKIIRGDAIGSVGNLLDMLMKAQR